jgi:hypothetical protein
VRVTPLRIAAIGIALVAGLLAILLAHDVRAWPDVLERSDLRYAVAPTAELRTEASTTLPGNISASLLGVAGHRRWLKALRSFDIAYADLRSLGLESAGRSDYALFHRGEAALRQVTQDPDAARASQAYNLLGMLVFREAFASTDVDPTLLQQGLTDLPNAVRLDANDEAARENLELGLRVLKAVNSIQQGHAAGTKTTSRRQGGYGGPPGRGY